MIVIGLVLHRLQMGQNLLQLCKADRFMQVRRLDLLGHSAHSTCLLVFGPRLHRPQMGRELLQLFLAELSTLQDTLCREHR